MKQTVLVVKTEKLFSLVPYFQGFMPCEKDVIRLLEENSVWLDKEQAEKDPSFKQLIGYCSIIGLDGKIFIYRRSVKDENYKEKRLQGKWSLGIGGHIKPGDSQENNPIAESIRREIGEEIDIVHGAVKNIRLIGMINDDTDSVGRVHFGLLLIAEISSSIAIPKDPEIALGRMLTMSSARSLFQNEKASVENWSLIGIPHISL